MTTIACKDGIIAYDGRVTAGGTIVYDDFDKMRESNGVLFVGAGSSACIADLVRAYNGEDITGDCDASIIVVKDGLLSLITYQDGKVWESAVHPDRPYAIGSGRDHAYTALDMGASAYQAVEMAAKRDTSTGGKIRTLNVKAE